MIKDKLPEALASCFPSADPADYPVAAGRLIELVQSIEQAAEALLTYEQELRGHMPEQLLALQAGKHLDNPIWRDRYLAEKTAALDLVYRLTTLRKLIDRAFQATRDYCPTMLLRQDQSAAVERSDR